MEAAKARLEAYLAKHPDGGQLVALVSDGSVEDHDLDDMFVLASSAGDEAAIGILDALRPITVDERLDLVLEIV